VTSLPVHVGGAVVDRNFTGTQCLQGEVWKGLRLGERREVAWSLWSTVLDRLQGGDRIGWVQLAAYVEAMCMAARTP
jgi:hypothetical protein